MARKPGAEELAKRLRANLLRRKRQQRARKEVEGAREKATSPRRPPHPGQKDMESEE